MRSLIAVALMLAGCSADVCTRVSDKLRECTDDPPPGAFSEIAATCRKLQPIDSKASCESRGCDDVERARAMFADCARSSSCDDFGGCFERNGCKLIMSGPGEPLAFTCDLR